MDVVVAPWTSVCLLLMFVSCSTSSSLCKRHGVKYQVVKAAYPLGLDIKILALLLQIEQCRMLKNCCIKMWGWFSNSKLTNRFFYHFLKPLHIIAISFPWTNFICTLSEISSVCNWTPCLQPNGSEPKFKQSYAVVAARTISRPVRPTTNEIEQCHSNGFSRYRTLPRSIWGDKMA